MIFLRLCSEDSMVKAREARDYGGLHSRIMVRAEAGGRQVEGREEGRDAKVQRGRRHWRECGIPNTSLHPSPHTRHGRHVSRSGRGRRSGREHTVSWPEGRARPPAAMRTEGRVQSSFRNSSTVSPASRTMPAIVIAFTGLARGKVKMRRPSERTMCLPCRTILNPAFSRPRTACLCGIPGSFGTRPRFRSHERRRP